MTDSGSTSERAHSGAVMQAAADWLLLAPEEQDDSALQERFSAWLADDPAHATAYLGLRALWDDPALSAALRRARATPDIVVPLAPRRRRHWPRIAALAAAAAIAAALVLPVAGDLWLGWQADYRTATGERQTVILPDGTEVELNTDTALALAFDGEMRRIELLRGEAHFAVRSDPSRPFVVAGGHAEVTATGTAFTVRREADADAVLLLEGQVAVLGQADRAATLLAPGEAVRVEETTLRTGSGAGEPAWRNGRITFDERPLQEVITEVDRYLPGRTLVLSGGDRPVSGTLLLGQLDSGLATLAAATGLDLRHLPGKLRIIW